MARHLGAEPQGDPLVRLDPQDQGVRLLLLDLRCADRQMRWPLKLQDHLGHARWQALAGADVERDAGPAPVVDVQPQRREGLGAGERINAGLLPVPRHELLPGPAAAVLAPDRDPGDVLRGGQADGLQQLDLLVPHGLGGERRRRLHQRQRQHLEDVVLEDVAGSARMLVEAAASLHTERLGHGDLHVIDPAAIPDRLEDRVGEPQREHVLDGVLPQVVVDPEHVAFGEGGMDPIVQGAGARLVVAVGLLDHDPARPAVHRAIEAGGRQVVHDGREGRRRGRQVEQAVAVQLRALSSSSASRR